MHIGTYCGPQKPANYTSHLTPQARVQRSLRNPWNDCEEDRKSNNGHKNKSAVDYNHRQCNVFEQLDGLFYWLILPTRISHQSAPHTSSVGVFDNEASAIRGTTAKKIENPTTAIRKKVAKNTIIGSTICLNKWKFCFSGSFPLGGLKNSVRGISTPIISMIAPSPVEWKGESLSRMCGMYIEDGYWETKVSASQHDKYGCEEA